MPFSSAAVPLRRALITSLGTRDLRQMGGLGKKMPFVQAVFVIGALGLVGLPIANGFFSKTWSWKAAWQADRPGYISLCSSLWV